MGAHSNLKVKKSGLKAAPGASKTFMTPQRMKKGSGKEPSQRITNNANDGTNVSVVIPSSTTVGLNSSSVSGKQTSKA